MIWVYPHSIMRSQVAAEKQPIVAKVEPHAEVYIFLPVLVLTYTELAWVFTWHCLALLVEILILSF